MDLENVERIAIAVKNLNRSREFFSRLLGIHFDDPLIEDNLKLRASYSSFGIELVEPTEPGTVIDNFIKQKGEGVFCIVIKANNLSDAVNHFEEMGLKRAGEMQYGNLREIAFHPRGSHGVQLVLCEYVAKHPATVAALEK